MGNFFANFFDYTYCVIKLSLMFWILTLMGGVIFGLGPALVSTLNIFASGGWHHETMQWHTLPNYFVENFKRGNLIFYSFALITLILIYNLYLALQIQGLWVLIIQFILVIVIIFMIVAFVYANLLEANFEMSFKNLWKLSLISVLSDFMTLLKMVGMLLIIAIITYKYLGLLAFLTFGLIIVSMSGVTKHWLYLLEEKLASS